MSKTTVKLNQSAVSTEILKRAEIVEYIEQIARERAPDGCEVHSYIGKNRANVEIVAVTNAAIKDCLENDTLLKAVSR